MIVEHRTYTLRPGCLKKFFELYGQEGLSVQTRYMGQPAGYYSVEIGNVNQIIHLWRFASFEDRMEKRKQLFQDTDWLGLLPKFGELIKNMESKILLPAPFFSAEG